MADTALPVVPTRAQLGEVFKEPRTRRAMEQLFQTASADLPAQVAAALAAADAAQLTANSLKVPQYLVAALSPVLTNERVLSGGTGVTVTFGAGTAVITINVSTALGYTPTSVTGLTGVQTVAAFKAGLAIAAVDLTNGTTGTGAVVLAVGATQTLPKTTGYTVATLPAAPGMGARAYVNDATAPAWGAALVGGGAVVCPVFFNGAAWVAG